MDDSVPMTSSPSSEISERMQALLSRAVDDQVNEQRQIQSLLVEVRTGLTQVQDQVRDQVRAVPNDDLRRRHDQHVLETGTALGALKDRLDAMVGAVSTSSQVLQGISGQIERRSEEARDQAAGAARGEHIEALHQDVGDLRGRLDGIEGLLRGELAGLQAGIRGDFDAVRAATAESTRSLAQHIDDAALVLAEALLRRPGASTGASRTPDQPSRDTAPAPAPASAGEAEPKSTSSPADEPERATHLEADPMSDSFEDSGSRWQFAPIPAEPHPAHGPASPVDLQVHHTSVDTPVGGPGVPSWDLERALFGAQSHGDTSGGAVTAAGTSPGADDRDDDDEDGDGGPMRRPWWRTNE